MRRHVLVLAAVGTAGLALLLSSAAAARPGVKLTATPPLVTSGTTATFQVDRPPRDASHALPPALAGTSGDPGQSVLHRARAGEAQALPLTQDVEQARPRPLHLRADRLRAPPQEHAHALQLEGRSTIGAGLAAAAAAATPSAAATTSSGHELRDVAVQVPQARAPRDQRRRAAVREPRQPGAGVARSPAPDRQLAAEPCRRQSLLLAGLGLEPRALAHRLQWKRPV